MQLIHYLCAQTILYRPILSCLFICTVCKALIFFIYSFLLSILSSVGAVDQIQRVVVCGSIQYCHQLAHLSSFKFRSYLSFLFFDIQLASISTILLMIIEVVVHLYEKLYLANKQLLQLPRCRIVFNGILAQYRTN